MAIQPIDLQIIYSQMSNVAKIAAQQQKGVQLTDAMQQNKIIQQSAEQIASVQKTASDAAKALDVKPDGGKNSQASGGNPKQKKKEEETPEKKADEFRESYLGQHIDITR